MGAYDDADTQKLGDGFCRQNSDLFPNDGHGKVNQCCDGHSVPNEVDGTIGNEFSKNGGKPPKEYGGMECNKCFCSWRSFGSHNLFKKSRPLIKAARMLVYKSA